MIDWIKTAFRALAALLGMKKAGQDSQAATDLKEVLHASDTRAETDDAARRTAVDSLRRSVGSDGSTDTGG